MTRLTQAGHIVVGTLWFEDYMASMGSRAGRQLLESAELIDVPRHLDADERSRAAELATTDRSIRAAMAAPDDGLTQVLAAGPELLRRWEHAPPYARAAITAAADARRIGILTPLSRELLVEAMAGYLSEAHRVAPTELWLREIAGYAEQGVNETTVAALQPVASRQPGTLAGYRAADYLAQHLNARRRTQCPPESLWKALIERLDSGEDIRRLRDAAAARMRYHLQEHALRKLSAAGDAYACVELALLLVRQDRIDAAVSALVACVSVTPTPRRRREHSPG